MSEKEWIHEKGYITGYKPDDFDNIGRKWEVCVSIAKLAEALVKAQSQFPAIDLNKTVKVQTRTGRDYEFSYATLAHIKQLTDPVLHKNGLTIVHLRSGNTLVSRLIHTSGEFIESQSPLRIHDNVSQQEEGSIISYQKRYAHAGLIGITPDEDDDANIADGNGVKTVAHEPGKPTKTRAKAPAKKDAFAEGAAEANDEETTPNYKFLQAMGEEKKRIGDTLYYSILDGYGYKSSKEITARSVQKKVYGEMKMQEAISEQN